MLERLNTTTFYEDLTQNQLYRGLRLFEDAVSLVCEGGLPLLICSGPPGVGKTHLVETGARRMHVVIRHAAPGSEAGFVQVLYRFRKGGIILLDDKDFVFRSERLTNILKIVADPRPHRVIPHDLVDGQQPFEVQCRVIILSNKDFDDDKSFKPEMLVHIDAIKSRARGGVRRLSFDPREMYDYTVSIARNMMEGNHIHVHIANDALRFFAEHLWRLPEISPRMLLSIARWRRDRPETWREHLEQDMLAEPRLTFPTPLPTVFTPNHGSATTT